MSIPGSGSPLLLATTAAAAAAEYVIPKSLRFNDRYRPSLSKLFQQQAIAGRGLGVRGLKRTKWLGSNGMY